MADDVKIGKPKIHKYKEIDLHYLCGKDKVLFENGAVISRKDFDAQKNVNGVIKSILDRSLASEPQNCNYDWAYACTTGQLRKKKGEADLVANIRTEKRRTKQTKELREVIAEAEKKTAVRDYVLSSVFLVTLVMVIVGVGSAIMSAYHTTIFLFQGGKPFWTSIITGTMLILFSGTAFTAARYFFQEKGALALFGIFFIITGLAVITYSMFSTLTVNFNQFKWRDDEQAVATVEGSEALSAHREQIRLLEEEIQSVSDEIGRLEGEAGYWRAQSWRRYDEIIQQFNDLTGYRRGLQEKRMELVGETPRLVDVEAVSQETVYSLLAGLFKVKEDTMRFFVYIVPACLYDILAPFALSVVLLLLDKRRKKSVT
jgi:hypothetical protein